MNFRLALQMQSVSIVIVTEGQFCNCASLVSCLLYPSLVRAMEENNSHEK